MRAPHFLLLVASSALSVVSINMFLPALPAIAEGFAVSPATAGWAISGYLAVTAVLQLALGPLSDRVGRRPVVLWGLAVFALASVGCALAASFGPFLASRLAMGVVVGVATAVPGGGPRSSTGPRPDRRASDASANPRRSAARHLPDIAPGFGPAPSCAGRSGR